MNVNGLITRVLEHVLDDDPDYPNERWSRDQILFHVRHALLLFAVLEPGSFTCVKRELLTPGGTIKLPSDCSTFIEASAVYDAKRGGTRLNTVRNTRYSTRRAPFPCTPGTYKLGSVAVDTKRPYTLILDPQVPVGYRGWLEFSCSCAPVASDTTDSTVPDRFEPALFDFILYRIYDTELESQYAQGKSIAHLNMFLRLMKLSGDTLKQAQASTRSARTV